MSSTTRGDLEALAREPYPGVVGVLTKSPLVLRDVDVLRALPQAEVGLTVTTTNDRLSQFLEVRAPLASRRLRMLAELHAEGDPDLCLRRATPAPLPLRPRCAGRRRSPPRLRGNRQNGRGLRLCGAHQPAPLPHPAPAGGPGSGAREDPAGVSRCL